MFFQKARNKKKKNPKAHRNYTFVLRETDQNGQLFPKSCEHVNLVTCRPLWRRQIF